MNEGLRDALKLTAAGAGGYIAARAKGRESESALAPSVLTTLTEWAARRNNEVAGG